MLFKKQTDQEQICPSSNLLHLKGLTCTEKSHCKQNQCTTKDKYSLKFSVMKNVNNLSLFTLTDMTGNTDLSLSAVYSTERRHGSNLHWPRTSWAHDSKVRQERKGLPKDAFVEQFYGWRVDPRWVGPQISPRWLHTESTNNKPNVTTKERNQRNSNLTFVQFYPTPRSSGSWFCRTKNWAPSEAHALHSTSIKLAKNPTSRDIPAFLRWGFCGKAIKNKYLTCCR